MKHLLPLWLLPFLFALLALVQVGWIERVPVQPVGQVFSLRPGFD